MTSFNFYLTKVWRIETYISCVEKWKGLVEIDSLICWSAVLINIVMVTKLTKINTSEKYNQTDKKSFVEKLFKAPR